MRTPARYTEIASAALALEDKPFLPVVLSQRHIQLCWGSQVSQHQLEQTLLHQHLSRKISTHRSTRQFQNPGALLMKFPQHQGVVGIIIFDVIFFAANYHQITYGAIIESMMELKAIKKREESTFFRQPLTKNCLYYLTSWYRLIPAIIQSDLHLVGKLQRLE